MLRALFACTFLLAASVSAQSTDWNRRISDIRIVHPPGSPPGTWKVAASVEWAADDSAPAPVDLSFEMRIDLNGTQIDLQTCDVTLALPQPCNWSVCNGGYCSSYWANNHHLYVGSCQQIFFGSGQSMCGCAVPIELSGGPWNSSLYSTDMITVTLTPLAGSLPEVETSDDSLSRLVGDNPIGSAFCFGDGSTATACPCANPGSAGHGCANSQDAGGALLEATGWSQVDPNTGTDTVVLHGSHMTATSTAIYLKGSSSNPTGVLFGDGVRCTAGSLIRLRVKINVGGASRFPESGDPSLSVAGGTPPGSGLTATYQTYYRDPASYCTALTYNITNVVSLDW